MYVEVVMDHGAMRNAGDDFLWCMLLGGSKIRGFNSSGFKISELWLAQQLAIIFTLKHTHYLGKLPS